MEGWVLLDLIYLREVWQLCIMVQQEALDHLCTLTHIRPDKNELISYDLI